MLPSIAGYTSFVASGQAGFPPAQSLSRVMPAIANAVPKGDTILVWGTISNGGVAGGALAITDNVNSGPYQLLAQIDDTGSGQSTWYLYAMFNSLPAAAGTLVISCTFPVLIWHGLFAVAVDGVTAAPLIAAAVTSWQVGVGAGVDAISSGTIAAGSKPAIILAATINTTIQAATGGGPPSAGSGFIQLVQDCNWNTSGTPGTGPEGTPDLPSCTIEYLVSNNPGTIPATFTAFHAGDNQITIAVALQASASVLPGLLKRRGRRGGLTMGLNLAEWF